MKTRILKSDAQLEIAWRDVKKYWIRTFVLMVVNLALLAIDKFILKGNYQLLIQAIFWSYLALLVVLILAAFATIRYIVLDR